MRPSPNGRLAKRQPEEHLHRQAGLDRRIAVDRLRATLMGDLDRADLEGRLVDGEVNLAPDASPGPAMLAGVPFALTAHLDAGAIDQQV